MPSASAIASYLTSQSESDLTYPSKHPLLHEHLMHPRKTGAVFTKLIENMVSWRAASIGVLCKQQTAKALFNMQLVSLLVRTLYQVYTNALVVW